MATIALMPLFHCILSTAVVSPVLVIGVLTDAQGPNRWLNVFGMLGIVGVVTAALSLLTTVFVGLPAIVVTLMRGPGSKKRAAFVGAICSLPALCFMLYALEEPFDRATNLEVATAVGFLTLYATFLGAAGGLLARYIWLPDPTR